MTTITKPASTTKVCEVLEQAFNWFAPAGRADSVEQISDHVRTAFADDRYAVDFIPGLVGVAWVKYRRRSYYLTYDYKARRWVAKTR
jgi:hypothetical protein